MSPLTLAALPLYAYLAVVTLPLTMSDLRERRLPNLLVLPGYPVAAASWLLALVLGGPFPFSSAVAGAVALLGLGVLAALGSLGMGDAKLAGLIACALGLHSWGAAVAGLAVGCVLGGIWALGSRLAAAGCGQMPGGGDRVQPGGRGADGAGIPLGPALLAGLWLVAGLAWGMQPPAYTAPA
ncbi:hypothetical protein GCM10022198_13280 [Klugiella xanthotipulae]|uniref:Type IV leader peptidase family protein n=1 Tax=Klugiella xanthotipulae TaxID=244735 RepID=A0A543I491_9MICO|nr:prepilin peptidase [Klugiella xanthotipulae]TQM65414.1 type IV leader peptidase family protein [Klugiella xanthotipulae]